MTRALIADDEPRLAHDLRDQFWQVQRSTLIKLAWLESTRGDEASRLFLRMRGHASALPVSRPFVHLFKAM